MNHGDVEIVDVDCASGVASAGAALTASPATSAAAAVSQVELADFPLPVHLLDGVQGLGFVVVTENHLLLKLNEEEKTF